MPWDMFCPKCCATLVGDMADSEEKMIDSQAEYEGSIIYCSHCDIYIDYNSNEIIDLIPFLHRQFNNCNTASEIKIINGG